MSDQWSIGVFAGELADAYAAFRAEEEPGPDEVELQLGEYASWHRRNIEERHLDHHLAYWRGQLEGIASLGLPTDRPRPVLHSSRGTTIHSAIDPAIHDSIERFARDAGATPFMVMLAAFQLLLSRYSGENDVGVGTAIANRNWLQGERVIGSLVNTVVMRLRIDTSASFRDLVADVQTTSLDAFAHQDMPFARLVTELGVPRDAGRSPLFQAFFNVRNAPFEAPSLVGTQTRRIDIERESSQFDISLSIGTLDRTAAFEYNTDLFDAARMEAMFDHYWSLLASVLDDPEAPLSSPALTMLGAGEIGAISRLSAPDVMEADLTVPAHRLVEATVRDRYDEVAVTFETDAVTYGELNSRANRLAHHLGEIGVDRGDVVGILLDRSVDMVVALLAVMKSGAAYVPMDPSHPRARLGHMIRDCDTAVVIVDAGADVTFEASRCSMSPRPTSPANRRATSMSTSAPTISRT